MANKEYKNRRQVQNLLASRKKIKEEKSRFTQRLEAFRSCASVIETLEKEDQIRTAKALAALYGV